MSNQPTILVKKSDGTMTRMTLDEVKKMKAANKQATQPTKGIPLIVQEDTKILEIVPEKPVMKDSVKITTVESPKNIINPAKDQAEQLLKTPELEPSPVELLLPSIIEPHLLEETLAPHEVKSPALLGGITYDNQIQKILSTARLSPPPERLSRYQSLVTSYLKGVRSLDQVMEYARLSYDQGGLALDEVSAARLLNVLEKDQPNALSKNKPGMPKPDVSPSLRLPKVVPQSVSPLPSPTPIARSPLTTTAMRDVEAPISRQERTAATAVMGPTEEMKNFSLRDWRRLALTPEKAKEIILNKFKSWEAESFFLYHDTRLAWLSSPLIRLYQDTVVEAINQATRLTDMTMKNAAREGLTAADVSALIEVNRSLGV